MLKKLSHIKKEDRYMGFLSCTIDMQSLYETYMKKIASKQWSHHIIASNNYKTQIKEIFDSKQNINILDNHTHQINKKNTLVMSAFSNYFTTKKDLKFSYLNKLNETIFCFLKFDGQLKNYAHLFQINSKKLTSPIFSELKLFSFYILIILFTLLLLGFIGIFQITKPILYLRKVIERYKSDLDISHFNDFQANTFEIRGLKNSIFNQVSSINRTIVLIKGLQKMQEAIHQKVDEIDFHKISLNLFQSLFQATLTTKKSLSKFTLAIDNKTYLFSSPITIKSIEVNPFIEQYQFFFLQDKLKTKHLASLTQKKQFELAQKVQQDLMPQNNLKSKNICSFYKAARFLGGDFYDNFSNKNIDYYIIADVSGKGLPSSLYGLLVKSYLMALIQNTDYQAEKLLSKLNDYLIKQNKSDFFCTLFLAKYNKKSKVLEYASAGHNKMILKNKNDLKFLSTKGLPIGMMDMNLYESKKVTISNESLLFLYTDGVTEAENQALELYGEENLYRFLETFKYNDAYLLSTQIEQELNTFCKNANQSDDITFVSIELNKELK
ncbi:MAG: hypothetical protein COB02_16645 [Candidatus Cloacimonadota bacterium]|nr:MAG: hypothetical protein COB02_16645 [Candidatus Cloacimonadota bacterium]